MGDRCWCAAVFPRALLAFLHSERVGFAWKQGCFHLFMKFFIRIIKGHNVRQLLNILKAMGIRVSAYLACWKGVEAHAEHPRLMEQS